MRRRVARFAAFVPLALVASMLGSGCTATAAMDSGVDANGADGDAAQDAGTCMDFSGAWHLTGWTCPGRPPALCIAQSGCDVIEHEWNNGTASAGTAVGSVLTIDRGCTFRPSPNESLAVTCTDELSHQRCAATAVRATSRDATHVCCDPFGHDCGPGERCATVDVSTADDDTFRVTACQPAGPRQEGQSCIPASSQAQIDMLCGDGLGCVLGVCRALCDAHGAPCALPNRCSVLAQLPVFGACSPVCSLLGTDCPMGETCRIVTFLQSGGPQPPSGACLAVGTGSVGDVCVDDSTCPADSGCFLQGPVSAPSHCLPYCHLGTAECAVGYHCVPLVNPSLDEVGFCAPL